MAGNNKRPLVAVRSMINIMTLMRAPMSVHNKRENSGEPTGIALAIQLHGQAARLDEMTVTSWRHERAMSAAASRFKGQALGHSLQRCRYCRGRIPPDQDEVYMFGEFGEFCSLECQEEQKILELAERIQELSQTTLVRGSRTLSLSDYST